MESVNAMGIEKFCNPKKNNALNLIARMVSVKFDRVMHACTAKMHEHIQMHAIACSLQYILFCSPTHTRNRHNIFGSYSAIQ